MTRLYHNSVNVIGNVAHQIIVCPRRNFPYSPFDFSPCYFKLSDFLLIQIPQFTAIHVNTIGHVQAVEGFTITRSKLANQQIASLI